MKFTIAGIGELLWDIYGDDKYPGGVPANVAIHTCNLGHNGIIASRIGRDTPGDELIDLLNSRGITTRYIQRDSTLQTGKVYIKCNPHTKPEYLYSKAAAFDHLSFNTSLMTLSEKADAVIFGTLGQRNKIAGETIRHFITAQKKAVIVYEAYFKGFRKNHSNQIKHSLHLCDILKVNKKEFLKLEEILSSEIPDDSDFVSFLFDTFKLRLICITLGTWGCIIMNRDRMVYSPGVHVTPVDDTGAGDAFTAALIIAFLNNECIHTIAEQANYTGAFTVTQKGAAPFYTKSDIKNFTQTHKNRNIKKNQAKELNIRINEQQYIFSP